MTTPPEPRDELPRDSDMDCPVCSSKFTVRQHNGNRRCEECTAVFWPKGFPATPSPAAAETCPKCGSEASGYDCHRRQYRCGFTEEFDQPAACRIAELTSTVETLRQQLKIPHPTRDFVNECNAALAAKDRLVETLKEERDKLVAGIDKVLSDFENADEQRLKEVHEHDAEAEKWKDEGDMYGWNFWKGVAGGMTSASIIYYRVQRRLTAIRAALKTQEDGDG